MTREEIKNAMAERGLTQVALAGALGINPKGLNEILRGARPMTAALRNHISLLLSQPREAVLVYRVDISEGRVEELCGRRACAVESDRVAAVEAVLRHNLAELVELGKKCDWSDEERMFLGLD